MTDFTDEDVQRGADALNRFAEHHLNESRARVALAAVLPEYAKRVRAEALREAADNMDTDIVPAYSHHALGWNDGVRHVQITVRAQADAEEGK
jgi:hypothetical protein